MTRGRDNSGIQVFGGSFSAENVAVGEGASITVDQSSTAEIKEQIASIRTILDRVGGPDEAIAAVEAIEAEVENLNH